MLLSRIAEALDLSFTGGDIEISGMENLRDARSCHLAFINDSKYLDELTGTGAGAVLVPETLKDAVPASARVLVCDDVSLCMAWATALFAPALIDQDAPPPEIGEGSFVDSRAHVENGAKIGRHCTVMAGAYLGSNAEIGDNTVLFPNVTVYRDSKIGTNCRIHAGTTIGADGFGYSHTKTGEHVKIFQNGNVVIEDNVEIGANSTIDRAVFNSTIIREGVKIDNLVHVGHNCIIGEHSLLLAYVGLAGSTTLGRNVVMGGQSSAAGHLSIAPFTTIVTRGGVTKDVKKAGVYSGAPLMEHRAWMKLQRRLVKLAEEGKKTGD